MMNASGTDPAVVRLVAAFPRTLHADASVVAVDGVVYAKLPFTTKYTDIKPADYGAPDPADLMIS